jgi:hypothetical protein
VDQPVQRSVVTPGSLFRLLSERFKERRPAECRACRMPLPYPVAPTGEGLPNWRIGVAGDCEHGCAAIMAAIAGELGASHDLALVREEAAAEPGEG